MHSPPKNIFIGESFVFASRTFYMQILFASKNIPIGKSLVFASNKYFICDFFVFASKNISGRTGGACNHCIGSYLSTGCIKRVAERFARASSITIPVAGRRGYQAEIWRRICVGTGKGSKQPPWCRCKGGSPSPAYANLWRAPSCPSRDKVIGWRYRTAEGTAEATAEPLLSHC